MTPERLLKTAILPALDELATRGIPASVQAARFQLAIALQESNLNHRRQVGTNGEENGPASSFWQFEVGGGCKGVLRHAATSAHMFALCDAYGVKPEPTALWEAMRFHDIVAAITARLLIYTLPHKLPETEAEGWAQYLEAWRPGKPHPERWGQCWAEASQACGVA